MGICGNQATCLLQEAIDEKCGWCMRSLYAKTSEKESVKTCRVDNCPLYQFSPYENERKTPLTPGSCDTGE
jgi:hypothetical protein